MNGTHGELAVVAFEMVILAIASAVGMVVFHSLAPPSAEGAAWVALLFFAFVYFARRFRGLLHP